MQKECHQSVRLILQARRCALPTCSSVDCALWCLEQFHRYKASYGRSTRDRKMKIWGGELYFALFHRPFKARKPLGWQLRCICKCTAQHYCRQCFLRFLPKTPDHYLTLFIGGHCFRARCSCRGPRYGTTIQPLLSLRNRLHLQGRSIMRSRVG